MTEQTVTEQVEEKADPRVEFTPTAVKDSLRGTLVKVVEIVQSMGGSNSIIDADQLFDRVEKETILVQQIENLAFGAHNLLKLLSPVITLNLPIHPEIGITVNGNIISMLMAAQGLDHDEFINEHYADQGYTTDPIPVPTVKDHKVLSVVTTMGRTNGWNTVFRSYSLGDNGVQVEVSELPIIRTKDGFVDYISILGWKHPSEEEAETFKQEFMEMLESAEDPNLSQMNQIEKWILYEDGLYNQAVVGDENTEGLDRGETKDVDIPLDGVLGDNIRSIAEAAVNDAWIDSEEVVEDVIVVEDSTDQTKAD